MECVHTMILLLIGSTVVWLGILIYSTFYIPTLADKSQASPVHKSQTKTALAGRLMVCDLHHLHIDINS